MDARRIGKQQRQTVAQHLGDAGDDDVGLKRRRLANRVGVGDGNPLARTRRVDEVGGAPLRHVRHGARHRLGEDIAVVRRGGEQSADPRQERGPPLAGALLVVQLRRCHRGRHERADGIRCLTVDVGKALRFTVVKDQQARGGALNLQRHREQ